MLQSSKREGKPFDSIIIEDLMVRATIGIADWERKVLQDIKISLELKTDSRKAAISDNIDDATNYKSICKGVIALVEESQHFLIEKLASEVAKFILGQSNIEEVVVRLEKPGALRFSKSVGIKITRTRADFF